MKESFLDDVLGFAGITHNSAGDPEHQAGVAVKKNLQSAGIVRLQTGHCVFVARDSRFRDMRRVSHAFPARVPHNWKCKSASWRHRSHEEISIGRMKRHPRRTPVTSASSPGGAPTLSRTYTKAIRSEKIFRYERTFFVWQKRAWAAGTDHAGRR